MIESTENSDLIMKCEINWEQTLASLVTCLQVLVFIGHERWQQSLQQRAGQLQNGKLPSALVGV